MAAPQLQISPENFNVSSQKPEDGGFVARQNLPTRQPAHLESALPPALARRVVEEAVSLTRPVRYRLTVEGESGSLEVAAGQRAVSVQHRHRELHHPLCLHRWTNAEEAGSLGRGCPSG